jgi:hypothetical protein
MLLPQVPMALFILSFKSRWQRRVEMTEAGDQSTAETSDEKLVRLSPAREARGATMQAPVSIARLASIKGQRIQEPRSNDPSRVFARVVCLGSSMICLTV